MKISYKLFQAAIFMLILVQFCAPGCTKFVEVDPPATSITNDNVYNSDATAIAVLNGIYTKMSSTSNISGYGLSTLSFFAGLSADELTLFSGATDVKQLSFYKNSLSVNNGGFEYWSPTYQHIYTCNNAIEGLESSEGLTPSVKQQLLGEAKFMRAFFYFYLVNLYGNVPLILTTDTKANSVMSRTDKAAVYEHIIADCKEAKDALSPDFLNTILLKYTSAAERVRPSRWAAAALLARTYLFKKDWANAELEATTVLSNTTLFDTVSLASTFLKNSKEAIWQLQPTTSFYNTEEARTFVIPTTGLNSFNPVTISSILLKSFEPGDLRRKNWIDSVSVSGVWYYYPAKYKVNTQNSTVTTPASLKEYLMVLRVGEQYLIRAEARTQQDKLSEGLNDVNVIRKRAGLPALVITNKTILLDTIAHEKQVELFTEWGHRWIDLKRIGKLSDVMKVVTPLKANGAVWQPFQELFPLPPSEIEKNGNLQQNDLY